MLKSMLNALTNLFKPVHTHNYPAQPIEHPANYRGLIEFGEEHCIYCDQCEKVCPPGAILFFQHEEGNKTYNYNPYLCIYCGECVRACPKPDEALWQSDKKPLPATYEGDVNSGWFEMERQCKISRENYAELKKAKKEAQAAEKTKEAGEGS